MARKFLYVFAALIVLAIAGTFAYRIWGNALMRLALAPHAQFVVEAPLGAERYADAKMWAARPDLPGNPALWTPAGYQPTGDAGGPAVFFIHPTSYLARDHWNAPLADAEANARTVLFVRGQASAFNAVGQIWAPQYRQATFGSFLTTDPNAARALDLAYRDVATAFEAFLQQIGPDRPIVLAGHSQGSLHLTRLLRTRIAGTPLARRIVAAYVVGWPVSRATDLAALGLPECRSADQPRCLLSWESFAEPADTSLVTEGYDATTGFDGHPRKGTPMVCTNPITGTPDATAAAGANAGTLYPRSDLGDAGIDAGKVPARCAAPGFLMIGEGPNVGRYVLPGNNYHVYDYSLFWANVRADVARRWAAFRR